MTSQQPSSGSGGRLSAFRSGARSTGRRHPGRTVALGLLGITVLLAGCGQPDTAPTPGSTVEPSAARTTGALATPSPSTATPLHGSGRTSAEATTAPASPGRMSEAEQRQTARQDALRPVLDRLAETARRQQKSSFSQLVSDADEGFASTAATIYRNLGVLKVDRLGMALSGQMRDLGGERSSTLGPGAFTAQVMITWRLPGDSDSAEHLVWMTFRPDHAPSGGDPADVGRGWRWAGIADAPTAGPTDPVPLWWLEPVTVSRGHGHTVIAGSVVDGAAWLRRATRAASAVGSLLSSSAAGVAAPDRGWNHRLVIEVPSTEANLDQMVGAAPGNNAQLAAITWPDAMAAQSAPMRILINPEVSDRQSGLGLDIVLTHEATHVATRSPASAAPLWLIEGYADYVAYATFPQAQPSAASGLLRHVRTAGAPRSVPDNQRFSPQAGDLSLAYAEAWYACRYLARHGGGPRLNAFYATVDRTADGTVDAGLKKIYRLTPGQLNERVRADLVRAARG